MLLTFWVYVNVNKSHKRTKANNNYLSVLRLPLLFRNTSVSHTGALSDTFLHYKKCNHSTLRKKSFNGSEQPSHVTVCEMDSCKKEVMVVLSL